MADVIPSDANIVTKTDQVEVLNPDGSPLVHNQTLSDIFDKVEAGTKVEDAVREVMTNGQEPQAQNKQELFDKKQEEVVSPDAEVKPDTEVKPDASATTEEVVPDEEMQVLPHDKPKTAKRIRALLTKIDSANAVQATTRKELDEKASKLQALEEELKKSKSADPVITDEIKTQLDELKMYRRKYELDNDPEIKTKFDSKISSSEEAIILLLKNKSAGEGLLNIIKEEGGWSKFADSKRDIRMADGSDVPANELAETILGNLSYRERREVDVSVNEQIRLNREKEMFMQEEVKRADSFFSERQKMTQLEHEKAQAEFEKNKKLVDEWHSKLETENEWLKEKVIPEGSKPEEKAAIEDDNKHTKQIRDIAREYIKVKSLPEALNMVGDAVKYHQERRENAKLHDKIKALEQRVQEFEKFKSAGRTTTKPGSIAGGGNTTIEPQRTPARQKSLEDMLDEMEQGKSTEQ